jgi:cytochrome c oxidase subunit I+III
MDPTTHVYPATVWILAIWCALHLGVGILMALYCVARRMFERIDPEHDMELHNVLLYWHFVLLTVAITVVVIAGFPLVA